MKPGNSRRCRAAKLSCLLLALLLCEISCLAAEKGKSGRFSAELMIDAEPVSEAIGAARRATLGEEVDIHVIFENPAVDNEGSSGVLMDSVMRRPDGSIVCEHRNLAGWVEKKPAPQGEPIEAHCSYELKPEPDDPPGRYTIEIKVKDIPGKTAILLTSFVDFVEPAPR